jgi:hypothetical protein
MHDQWASTLASAGEREAQRERWRAFVAASAPLEDYSLRTS